MSHSYQVQVLSSGTSSKTPVRGFRKHMHTYHRLSIWRQSLKFAYIQYSILALNSVLVNLFLVHFDVLSTLKKTARILCLRCLILKMFIRDTQYYLRNNYKIHCNIKYKCFEIIKRSLYKELQSNICKLQVRFQKTNAFPVSDQLVIQIIFQSRVSQFLILYA